MKPWMWWLLIGAALLCVLVYKHQNCPECRAKWNAWLMNLRNRFANRVAQREDSFDANAN